MKFDKAGVFEYSREKNTYAYSLKPQIKANIKKKRRNALMKIQKEISTQINKNCHNIFITFIILIIFKDTVH